MSVPHLSDVAPLNIDFRSKSDYEKQLQTLQTRLLHIQQALFHAGERAILVFEGTDASGKGGAIRRATALLDPRGFRVHAIGAPNPEEQGRHYLWRFFRHLPPPGRIALFDRSWYGRVLVERVEGLASDDAWQRAYREITEFERWLTDDGIKLIKIYLSIDQEEQNKRFAERLSNPHKYWKLTEEDIRNRRHWDEYVEATNDMFAQTHRPNAPWHVLDGRHKWSTRIAVLSLLTETLAEGLEVEPPAIDAQLLREAREALGVKLTTKLPISESKP